jgi:hypothetical protein
MTTTNPIPSRPRATARRASALAALAAGILAAASAGAQRTIVVIETVLESGTEFVSLPGAAGGTINARECRGCPSVRLKFDASTRYFIGREPVSYARFRKAAAEGPGRLYVYFTPETRVLTRLRLDAAPPAKK